MQQYLTTIKTIIDGEHLKDGYDLREWLKNHDSDEVKEHRLLTVCYALFDALDTLERITDLAKGI